MKDNFWHWVSVLNGVNNDYVFKLRGQNPGIYKFEVSTTVEDSIDFLK